MENNQQQQVIFVGANLGTCIATILSYAMNKSIWWMILHGFFGWFYVIYYAIKY